MSTLLFPSSSLTGADLSLFPPPDCNEGYYRKNNKCFPYAPAATTTTEQAWSAPAETQAAAAKVELASTSDNNVLASVSAFKGVNTGAIASWFHTNSGSGERKEALRIDAGFC